MELIFFPLELLRMRWMLLAATLFSQESAMAQQAVAYTSPRGIYTVKVPGTLQATVPVRTYLGIQLMQDSRFEGLASNVIGNTVSFQSLSDYAAVADPVRKCFIHVLTGNGRGLVSDIEQYGISGFVCAEDLTPWIQPGTRVRIRPHRNIVNIFGVSNRFGLGAGTDADSTDNVVVWDPDTQQERVYYYHSTRARWEEKGSVADAGAASFRFPYGFYIVRRSPGTLRIALSGEVGADAILLPVRSAANVFSLPVNLSASLDTLVRATGSHSVISGEKLQRCRHPHLRGAYDGQPARTLLLPFQARCHRLARGRREWQHDSDSAAGSPLDLDSPAGWKCRLGLCPRRPHSASSSEAAATSRSRTGRNSTNRRTSSDSDFVS